MLDSWGAFKTACNQHFRLVNSQGGTALSIDAIRFYERRKLLPPAWRAFVKAVERGAPAAAILAALSALVCCLPSGLVGAVGLASVGVWIAPLRPWLLGAAAALLVLGFWQIYRRGSQCSTQRSPLSVTLFWVAVAVVVLVTIFPQLIANWLAG